MPDQVRDAVLRLAEGTRLNVLFPILFPSTSSAGGHLRSSASASDEAPAPATRKATAGKRKKKAEAGAIAPDAIKNRLLELRQRGFNRLFQRGQVFEFSTPESLLDLDFSQTIFVLLDRIVISPEAGRRIVDATEIAFRESGEVLFLTAPTGDQDRSELRFSERFECKTCGLRYEEPEPSLFSFNNPYGA